MVGVQDSQNRGREDNTAIGGFCLWLGHHQFPSHSMHLTLYPQSTGAEIKVIPLKGADFAPAQARGQFQQEQLIAPILFGLNEKPLDFLRGQHLHFSGLGRR